MAVVDGGRRVKLRHNKIQSHARDVHGDNFLAALRGEGKMPSRPPAGCRRYNPSCRAMASCLWPRAERLKGVVKKSAFVERMTTGAKAQLIQDDLRGPKGPLFHGCANIAALS